MGLGQLLDQIRAHYVDRFLEALQELADDDSITVATEPAYCDSEGVPVTDGDLCLPIRGDCFIIQGGSVIRAERIDTEDMLSFDELEFVWPDKNLQVELGPFQWNWMQLRIFGLSHPIEWRPVCNWYLKWFKENDPTDSELLEGVHCLCDPEQRPDCIQLSVDLGTAPVECFEELLDAVGVMGAHRLQIGQFEETA